MIKENKSKILLILASAALLASAVFVTSCASAPQAEEKPKSEVTKTEPKKETKIKNAFEALLDYVREVYFSNDHSINEQNPTNSNNNSHNNDDSFKFTSLDLLINPLRKSFPWETWSPYEIALFNHCICKFTNPQSPVMY